MKEQGAARCSKEQQGAARSSKEQEKSGAGWRVNSLARVWPESGRKKDASRHLKTVLVRILTAKPLAKTGPFSPPSFVIGS